MALKDTTETMLNLQGLNDSDTELKNTLSQCKKELEGLVRKRATVKRKITLILKKLVEQGNNTTLSNKFFELQSEEIRKSLLEIDSDNDKILAVYDKFNIYEVSEEVYINELDNQTEYKMSVEQNLCEVKLEETPVNKHSTGSNEQSSSHNFEIRAPPLNCPIFSGEGVDKFEFKTFLTQFENIIGSKKNLSDSSKLVYLRGYLSKYAFKLIQYLSVCDDNYSIALDLLKQEFLDLNFMVDELMKKLLYTKPNFDNQFVDTRKYLNDMRSLLYELQSLKVNFLDPGSAGCTLVSHVIFNKLPMIVKRELTHKVGSNYPSVLDIFEHYNEVLKMLNKTTSNNFFRRDDSKTNEYSKPNVFSNPNSFSKPNFRSVMPNSNSNSYPRTFTSGSYNKPNFQESTLQNFQASVKPKEIQPVLNKASAKQNVAKSCKFCSTTGHSLLKCSDYPSTQARERRCRQLNLCEKCTSGKHNKAECPGNQNKLPFNCQICHSNSHIAALCDQTSSEVTANNLSLSCSQTSGSCTSYLLPTITIKLGRGSKTVMVRCLIDTGSQRSYFSQNVMKRLNYERNIMSPVDFEIRTFIGCENRVLNESMLEIFVTPNLKVELPVLIDDKLTLKFSIPGVTHAIANLVNDGFELADEGFMERVDPDPCVIDLEGLIGVDILQFFPKFEIVKCMHGSAFSSEVGIVPFGNIKHFMTQAQISEVADYLSSHKNSSLSNVCKPDFAVERITPASNSVELDAFDTGANSEHDCPAVAVSIEVVPPNSSVTLITNSVMEPTNSYFSPFDHMLPNSNVEQGLENLFSLESIGICEDETMSTEDELKIKEFNDGIEFVNGRYYVELPWYHDKISQVPSNSNIALAVLNRTVANLSKKGLLLDYQNVFEQQLTDGIIERIFVKPCEYENFIWIPHRPIIKIEQQVTTKIRPVFNASLKIDGLPSLNESAYTGIDLMSSLPKLLLHFRSNPYVMLSDVKQAFLQIKLKLEADKNRFAFFWKKDGELISYRYNTLIFGFTSSPFILNYIIKYHVNAYPNDNCTQLLSNNFYVDNLIVSGKNLDYLKNIYELSNSRMEEGGFTLRSWATNDKSELKGLMEKDGRLADHGCDEERVLGYRYNTVSDSISLANFELNATANTKRKILAQTSKVFDPLSLFLPVTISGRILMRSLWMLKLGWDDNVPLESSKAWSSLYHEYNQLKDISAPRCAFTSSEVNSMHVFCDASKISYGFAVYAHNGSDTNLIFAKAKVAPIQERTLPSLELLSVFLAMKCLNTLLSSYDNQFKFLNVFVDAQIVLSWLLSGNVKVKNVFVKNRVKDIMSIKTEIENKYKLKIKFCYVNTMENPADLITRGISTKEFQSKFAYWMKGPTWISNNLTDVPKSDLSCLSEHSKSLTTGVNIGLVNLQASVAPPLLDVNKYSNYNKLLRVTSYVFKFFSKCRKVETDHDLQAKLYWLKRMQLESFPQEIDFLKNKPNDKTIPSLVNQLDLFIDKDNILRSRGRIQKALLYSYDVLNPIMIGKGHALSNLIIMDSHKKCQHLGLQTTINFLRNCGFWVPRARQAVKNVISACYMCKKFNNLALQYPKMTNMAKSRMKLVKPFDHTGVDYTGHFFVKDNNSGKCVKMYILVFTCMNIRAVHLDLVPDMSTQSFLMSYQRFSNLYGIPSFLYSDNAKSFTAAGKILETSLTSSLFKEHLAANNTKHIPIPVYSAWVGSMWERLIRVLKSCLFKTVGRAKLTYFELLTSLSNIQNVINSRPLTYRSSENDLDVISPNSFLQLQGNHNLILRSPTQNDYLWNQSPPGQKDLDHILDLQEETFDKFKQLWFDSYLLGLREHSRNMYQSDWINRIAVGDVVLVKMPNKPRPFWLLGRVLEVFLGHDNKIRSVLLYRADGTTCHHSICHLYPMELSLTHHYVEQNNQNNIEGNTSDVAALEDEDSANNTNENVDPVSDFRPPRRAAVECQKRIRDIIAHI